MALAEAAGGAGAAAAGPVGAAEGARVEPPPPAPRVSRSPLRSMSHAFHQLRWTPTCMEFPTARRYVFAPNQTAPLTGRNALHPGAQAR